MVGEGSFILLQITNNGCENSNQFYTGMYDVSGYGPPFPLPDPPDEPLF